MIRTRLIGAAGGLAAVLATPSLALAADYYFDSVGGKDSADGATEDTPKQKLELPRGADAVVHLKRGSSWSGGLNVSGITVKAYGCGERPIIGGAASVSGGVLEGIHVKPTSGNAIMVQGDSTVRNCDADGSSATDSAMGITVMG
jgi:hypothetical protein